MGSRFVVARNPDPASKLPYLLGVASRRWAPGVEGPRAVASDFCRLLPLR